MFAAKTSSKNQVQPTWAPDGAEAPLLDHRLSGTPRRNTSQQKFPDEYNTASHMRRAANAIRPGETGGQPGALAQQGSSMRVKFSLS